MDNNLNDVKPNDTSANNKPIDENTNTNNVTPVAGPTVAPPSVSSSEQKVNEEDGILKPSTLIEEVKEDDSSKTPTLEPLPADNSTIQKSQQDNQNQADSNQKDKILENKKMEQVQIDYKPPSKFKIFIMIMLFVICLGVTIFLPQISLLMEKINEKPNVEVPEEEIKSGTLTCNLETNDDKFDLIYLTEFSFTDKELKNLSYSITTKGDKTLDSTALDNIYNNCTKLSEEAEKTSVGVEINCDEFEGTVKIDQSIDFANFDLKAAKTLFDKFSIELADFEEDQNIDDIERSMKNSGYSCDKVASTK